MEYTDVCHVACDRAVGKGGGSIERGILVVEKKVPDKVVKVHLSYVLPKCVERGGGVFGGWFEDQ